MREEKLLSYDLSEIVTVVVISSPSRFHPSTSMIEEVIESIQHNVLDEMGVRFILAHDAPRDIHEAHSTNYFTYIENLKRKFDKAQFKVVVRDSWGHISGNISNALRFVETPYVLICQHDLKFVRKVRLDQVLKVMELNKEIKHVRFNLHENIPNYRDIIVKQRSKYFGEIRISNGDSGLALIQTLSWSDNNHLTRVSYYQEVVFPLVGEKRIPPEHACDRASRKSLHKLFGTYIYGGFGDPPVLEHLDGRHDGIPELGWHLAPIFPSLLGLRVTKNFAVILNKAYLRINLLWETLFFGFKARKIAKNL